MFAFMFTSPETKETASKPDVDQRQTAKSSGKSVAVLAVVALIAELTSVALVTGVSMHSNPIRAKGAAEKTARMTAVRVASLMPARLTSRQPMVRVTLHARRTQKTAVSFRCFDTPAHRRRHELAQ